MSQPLQADAIAKIEDLAKRAMTPLVISTPEAAGKFFVAHGGSLAEHDRSPKPIHGNLVDYASVVAFALDHPDGEVWMDDRTLVMFCDREDRWEYVGSRFGISSRFEKLCTLRGRLLQPKDAVRVLRIELEYQGPLLDRLRRVSFSRGATGSQNTEHGKESWGRAVEAEVQGADSIPEWFDYSTSLFTTPGFQHYTAMVRIHVHIDLDPAAPHIELIPSQDGIAAAKHSIVIEAIEELRRALGKDYPVYYGSVV